MVRKLGGWNINSAEVVVASDKPGAVGPHKLETGNLEAVKDRTDEEPLTAWRTSKPITTSWWGEDESRHDGSRNEVETASRRLPKGRAKPGNHEGSGTKWLDRKIEVTVSEEEETPTLAEPPGTDPYAGWCAPVAGLTVSHGDPIRLILFLRSSS